MFRAEVVRKVKKKHVLCSVTFFDNLAVYETRWKNTVEPGRPQMTIWRMRIACWTPTAPNTHSEYVILTAFPPQKYLRESASLLCHTFTVCLFIIQMDRVFWELGTEFYIKCK